MGPGAAAAHMCVSAVQQGPDPDPGGVEAVQLGLHLSPPLGPGGYRSDVMGEAATVRPGGPRHL